MHREEPEAEVHPSCSHNEVENYLDDSRSHIAEEFEDSRSQVSHIMQNHHRCSHRQIVYYVGEKNESESKEVMEHVLWEIRPLHVKHYCANQLIAVIRHLKDVEAIKVFWEFLARMVIEI